MKGSGPATLLFKPALIKSALVHVCVILLLAISPGFNVAFEEKPVDVIWVDIPRGPSDEIGLGIEGAPGYPPATVEQLTSLPPPEQIPLEVKPRVDLPEEEALEGPEQVAEKPARKRKVEKTVIATGRMTYQQKGAPRVVQRRRTKTDATIASALAAIDRSLAERGEAPGAVAPGGVPGASPGYKYGTSTVPLRVPPSDPEYIKYQAQVRGRIISNWIVPERFVSRGGKASAKIIVMINMDGEVISTRWSMRSGDPSFDESCKRAVEKSSPLPRPPQRLAWETYNEGFLVAFDARVR